MREEFLIMDFTTRKGSLILGSGVLMMVLSGCGHVASPPTHHSHRARATKSTAGGSKRTVVIGGKPYQGQKNLRHWESLAKKKPKDVKILVGAGVSAFQNSHPHLAIQYYQQALALDPRSGLIDTNIGNVYRDSLHEATKAIQYYQKATQIQPSYNEGWFNWAYTEATIGQKSTAKKVAAKALTVLPTNDSLHNALRTLAQKG